MTKTKKLINNPDDIIPEMIEGILGAHPDLLGRTGETGRAVVAMDGPRQGKVGIVVGGGSGHEPAFVGYVGRGLADAAAIGNVFASPSPEPILEATRAVDGGAGVLYLYGNYSGDVMNFDMAAEEAAAEGIKVRTVRVTDDVASAPTDRAQERRGIAGDFFVFKIAGAAADRMADLDAVVAVTEKANRATFTMGVALGACSLPQTLKPNFSLGDDEMEIGMGIHGEPGIRRGPLETADQVTDALLERIFAELTLAKGEEVALLVNGLGSTSQMELYLLHRRVKQHLDEKGVSIHRSFVGEYVTSLEMAGASITLLKLDDELKALLEHPCHTAALQVGIVSPRANGHAGVGHGISKAACNRADAVAASSDTIAGERPGGEVTPEIFVSMIRNVGAAIETHKDWLSELDGVIGDGDHGVTMGIGWSAVGHALDEVSDNDDIEAICKRIAKAFLDAVGASSGPLYATAFQRAGASARGRAGLDGAAMVAFIDAAANGIRERGKAEPGDKTMVDAWVPAAHQAAQALQGGASTLACLQAAARGAEEGMNATAKIAARKGRSSKLGERSLGHIDPGAASTFVTLRAMAEALERALR
ncbi:dihydroxyacetone kinase subunit DhaL [Pseudaminobacter salicylatoxidans]|uniref:dihydroxyacetone kinase subunit DhaL n=1 Tax=Pseudaminobacter salicylatoxidans TaxID=93369 RepID=UPI0002F2F23D|nr:dihydroxyacetone kinase subunit DhaL [Pseudaminobacter salicylatoxidans]